MTDDDNDDPAQARFTLCREQVVGLIDRARDVVSRSAPVSVLRQPAPAPQRGLVRLLQLTPWPHHTPTRSHRSSPVTPSPPTGHSACSRKARSSSSAACRTRATQPFWSTSSTTGSRPRASTSRCEAESPLMGFPRRPLQARDRRVRHKRGARLGSRPAHRRARTRPRRRLPATLHAVRVRGALLHLHEESDRYDDEFRRICAFDIVINNTDRKASHCCWVSMTRSGPSTTVSHSIKSSNSGQCSGTSSTRTFPARGATTSGASSNILRHSSRTC